MTQIARNLTDDVDGFLKGKRYLIHDRDPLYTQEFLSMLAEAGILILNTTGRNDRSGSRRASLLAIRPPTALILPILPYTS